MTIPSLYKEETPAESAGLPFAEALPLNDPKSGAGPAKAYAVKDDRYDYEAQGGKPPMAETVGEAQVMENLGWDPRTRKLFIQRVYTILAAQLMLTFVVSAFMSLHAPTQAYVLTHGWPMGLSMAASIVSIVALMCYKEREPLNMYLLWIFTFAESFLVGSVVTMYCAAGYQGIVLEAVLLTGLIFIGLTCFTCRSKIDFSFMGAFLSMGLGALILWGFFAMIFGAQTGYVYALLGCVIFSGYILFDTWLIMEKLSPHEHVLAAIMLYLDIINLFLYLLRLLAESNRNN